MRSIVIGMTSLIILSASQTGYAQENPPDWMNPLPSAQIECFETSSTGQEFSNGLFNNVKFHKNTYTIKKLSEAERQINPRFCKISDKPNNFRLGERFMTSSCYRYDNALNLLGTAQEWCREIHHKNKPVEVWCESENAQPRLYFSPGGFLLAYGRLMRPSNDGVLVPAAFTASGICGAFRSN